MSFKKFSEKFVKRPTGRSKYFGVWGLEFGIVAFSRIPARASDNVKSLCVVKRKKVVYLPVRIL